MLRTVITCLIIAIGIAALVGMLTAVDGIEKGLSNTFQKMGSNTFNIRNRDGNIRIGGGYQKRIEYAPITYAQARLFKKDYTIPATVSLSTSVSMNATLKSGSKKTNPNIRVLAADESYFSVSGTELRFGRNSTAEAKASLSAKTSQWPYLTKKMRPEEPSTLAIRSIRLLVFLKAKGAA